jgi:acyl-CoA thioester hydrolase
MYSFDSKLRVRYGETDRMGYLYYGHYPEYFEVSRTELIRSLGLSYREIEDRGIILPVRNLTVEFKRPALYDELLLVRSFIRKMPEVRLDIDYEVYNEKGLMICKGNTILVFVEASTGRPRKAPEILITALSSYFK